MINLLGWLICGILVGLASARLSNSSGSGLVSLYVFAGLIGAISGGIVPLIYETRPLHELSMVSLALALVGAAALVALTRALMRRQL